MLSCRSCRYIQTHFRLIQKKRTSSVSSLAFKPKWSVALPLKLSSELFSDWIIHSTTGSCIAGLNDAATLHHYTVCLIGILIKVYHNPHTTGKYYPLYTLNSQVFFSLFICNSGFYQVGMGNPVFFLGPLADRKFKLRTHMEDGPQINKTNMAALQKSKDLKKASGILSGI